MIWVFRCFLNEESGATSIEYGLIAALISLTVIGTATSIGGDLKSVFSSLASSMRGASSGG